MESCDGCRYRCHHTGDCLIEQEVGFDGTYYPEDALCEIWAAKERNNNCYQQGDTNE